MILHPGSEKSLIASSNALITSGNRPHALLRHIPAIAGRIPVRASRLHVIQAEVRHISKEAVVDNAAQRILNRGSRAEVHFRNKRADAIRERRPFFANGRPELVNRNSVKLSSDHPWLLTLALRASTISVAYAPFGFCNHPINCTRHSCDSRLDSTHGASCATLH